MRQIFHDLGALRTVSIDDRTPLVTTDARSRSQVKETVLALLEHVLAGATSRALVSH